MDYFTQGQLHSNLGRQPTISCFDDPVNIAAYMGGYYS